jgi:hypothetical protein
MDRWHRQTDEYSPAMRTGRTVTAGLVLRACGRECGESRADAAWTNSTCGRRSTAC